MKQDLTNANGVNTLSKLIISLVGLYSSEVMKLIGTNLYLAMQMREVMVSLTSASVLHNQVKCLLGLNHLK